jgi:hypothetical protein
MTGPENSTSPKKSWLRPRFTIGALLLLITLCAPFLAYLSLVRKRNDQRKAAYDASVTKGAVFQPVDHAPPKPSEGETTARQFWASVIGEPNLPTFGRIAINDLAGAKKQRPPITDADLHRLQYLPEIEDFHFYYSKEVTDEGLKVLGKLPKLKRIMLQDLHAVSGEFLDSLPEDCALETIWITSLEGLDGRKLQSLRRLKNLKMLWISHSSLLTDASLREVTLPPNIKDLNIGHVPLGDETLERWLSQVELERLEIRAPITRALIPALAKQTSLSTLAITNAPLVDEDFMFLKNFTHLSSLKLNAMPLRGEVLDLPPNPDKIGLLELNNTLISDAQLPKIARYEKLGILGLAWTPITGEGFGGDVHWPRPGNIELSGTRFTDAGMDAFAKLKGLKMVMMPSNWTPEDHQRFEAGTAPTQPCINGFVGLKHSGIQTYLPSIKLEKIDNCPSELMKPVAELQALGLEEDKVVRESWEKR